MGEGYHHFDNDLQNRENGVVLNDITGGVPNTAIIKRRPWKPRWCNDGFKVLVAGAVVFSLTVLIALIVDISLRGSPAKHVVEVITDDPTCTEVVKRLLRNKKANAVDGATAGMICLAVVRPDHTSLASGGYMVVHSAGTSKVIDFQLTVPDVYQKQQQSVSSYAVPVLVEGLRVAHKKYGKLAWQDIIGPSSDIARTGFAVSEHLAKNIADSYSSFPTKMKKIFSKKDGRPYKTGDILKIEGLYDLLLDLSKDKIDKLNEEILEAVNVNNLLNWTKNTLHSEVKTIENIVTSVDDIEITSTPFPSSGMSLISVLNILHKLKPHSTNVSESYRQLAEVLNVMFENAKIQNVEELLGDKYATKIAEEIIAGKPVHQTQLPTTNNPGSNTGDCTGAKVVVIDGDGQAVSVVSSLGRHMFGAMEMTAHGVVLNDGMRMFETSQRSIEALQRCPSFASPVIAVSKKFPKSTFAFGASTDREGVAALLQVLKTKFIDWKSLHEAMRETRIMYDKSSSTLTYEGKSPQSDSFERSQSYLHKFYKTVSKLTRDLGNVMCAVKLKKSKRAWTEVR